MFRQIMYIRKILTLLALSSSITNENLKGGGKKMKGRETEGKESGQAERQTADLIRNTHDPPYLTN